MMSAFGITLTMTTKEQNFSKELGSRIASLRKEHALTQQELAEALGIKQYTVARFELGLCRVPTALLPNLGHIFGVTVDGLLGLSTGKTKPGPAPKLQRQLKKIQALPKEKQKFVLQAVELALQTS